MGLLRNPSKKKVNFVEIDVLVSEQENPKISTRKIASNIAASYQTT